MPVHVEIFSAGGQLLKEADPIPPPEAGYIRSFFRGELVSIIGARCLQSDLGGVLHVVDDPELILAVSQGTDVTEILDDTNAIAMFTPEGTPVKMPFTTMHGYPGEASYYHTLPEEPFNYN